MPVLKSYNLAGAVRVILDAQRLTGFGATDVATVEPAADIMEDQVSADGDVTVSYLNDDRLNITLTLTETQFGYRIVAEAMQAQLEAVRNGLPIPSLSFSITDELNGDKTTSDQAVFKTRPGGSKGRTGGDRVFVLMLPSGTRDDQLGVGIT